MILTAAFEFNPEQSPLVKHRPSDDLELSEVVYIMPVTYSHSVNYSGPIYSVTSLYITITITLSLSHNQIIRSKALPYIDIKTKENPFCAPYAAKARMLVHAHLERMLLRPDTLQIGTRGRETV